MYILANSLITIRKNAGGPSEATASSVTSNEKKRSRDGESPASEEGVDTTTPLPGLRTDAGKGQFTLEEMALFESIRTSGDPMGTLVASFLPYYLWARNGEIGAFTWPTRRYKRARQTGAQRYSCACGR